MNKITFILKSIALIFLGLIILSSCKKEDPVIPNEEELITTMTYTLTPIGGGDAIIFNFQDLDGDGGNDPIITSGVLQENTNYIGSLELLNETETPAGDISSEVEEEGEDHQFFFIVEGDASSSVQIDYQDEDVNGNPLGLATTFATGNASSGTLTIVLRHKPLKPNNGSLVDAGGETDIQVTFDLNVQ